MGAGGAPPAGETPVAEATTEGSILHAETSAPQKAWQGETRLLVYSVNQRLVCFVATHGYSHTTGHQEMEQMQGYNQRLIEEMKNRQAQERARLPKIQRSEAKTRMAMFKKSLRITGTGTPEQDREKIKQVRPSVRKLC